MKSGTSSSKKTEKKVATKPAIKSTTSSKKSVVSTYVDKPSEKELGIRVKAATKEQDSGANVALNSVSRPENSYPTPKQEYDAAKKQQ